MEDGKRSWTSGINVRRDQSVLTAGRPDTVGKNISAPSLFTRFYYITCYLLLYDPFKYSQQEKPSCLENREENISRETVRKLQTQEIEAQDLEQRGSHRLETERDWESQINTKNECVYMRSYKDVYICCELFCCENDVYVWKSSTKSTVIALQKCFWH